MLSPFRLFRRLLATAPPEPLSATLTRVAQLTAGRLRAGDALPNTQVDDVLLAVSGRGWSPAGPHPGAVDAIVSLLSAADATAVPVTASRSVVEAAVAAGDVAGARQVVEAVPRGSANAGLYSVVVEAMVAAGDVQAGAELVRHAAARGVLLDRGHLVEVCRACLRSAPQELARTWDALSSAFPSQVLRSVGAVVLPGVVAASVAGGDVRQARAAVVELRRSGEAASPQRRSAAAVPVAAQDVASVVAACLGARPPQDALAAEFVLEWFPAGGSGLDVARLAEALCGRHPDLALAVLGHVGPPTPVGVAAKVVAAAGDVFEAVRRLHGAGVLTDSGVRAVVLSLAEQRRSGDAVAVLPFVASLGLAVDVEVLVDLAARIAERQPQGVMKLAGLARRPEDATAVVDAGVEAVLPKPAAFHLLVAAEQAGHSPSTSALAKVLRVLLVQSKLAQALVVWRRLHKATVVTHPQAAPARIRNRGSRLAIALAADATQLESALEVGTSVASLCPGGRLPPAVYKALATAVASHGVEHGGKWWAKTAAKALARLGEP